MGAAMAPLAIAAVGASAAASIAGGYQAAAAEKANAQIAERNADIARQNATFAAQEGEANAGMQSERNRATMANLKASQGASGVEVNSGSNANVQASQAEIGQLDTMNIRANAARQAYGFITQAGSYEAQANADRAAAKNSITAGYISGITGAASKAAEFSAIGGGGGGAGGGSAGGSNISGNNGLSYEDSAFGNSGSTYDPWGNYQSRNSLSLG